MGGREVGPLFCFSQEKEEKEEEEEEEKEEEKEEEEEEPLRVYICMF